MASFLAEKIGSDFLTCGICLQSYMDPRALPCHHGFCLECLECCLASSKNKGSLVCPTCSKVVKLSNEGVKDLPVHFLVNSLKDAVEMSEKRSDIINCSNCNAKKTAVVRCMNCRQDFCDTCLASHTTLKTMRNHRVESIEDIVYGKVDLTGEENNVCKEHKEPHKYFCQNENKAICQDCVILKKCPPEHDRITIDEAVQEKSEELGELMKRNNEILKKYKNTVKQVNITEKELEIHTQLAKSTLTRAEQECIKLVKQSVKRLEDEIDDMKEKRKKKLERTKYSLESTLKDIEKTIEDVTRVIKSPYKMEVITSHTILSSKFQTFSKCQPEKIDKTLGYLKFEAAIPSNLNIGQLLKAGAPGTSWKLIDGFSTGDFSTLMGLALDEDDIIACSWFNGIKVFTRNGEVKSTLYDSLRSVSVGVLPGQKYVIAPFEMNEIKICDSQGKQAVTCPITDVNNVPSAVPSITVDYDNKIIVGQFANTISIHNADGSLISKFATQSTPYCLAVTSNGEIVGSFTGEYGTNLMDYSGGNVRVIQPPDEVLEWRSGFVCCGQGELFVSNKFPGDPCGVYRYTSEGDYLGCVTAEVTHPQGIALSKDGMELFVAEWGGYIKIFQRP